jgi:quercetin dioxygenase-like cupin family protein
MHEFFFILEGKVLFTINGKETLVEKGTMVHVTPYELHQLDAPFDSSVIMLVSGITVEDR